MFYLRHSSIYFVAFVNVMQFQRSSLHSSLIKDNRRMSIAFNKCVNFMTKSSIIRIRTSKRLLRIQSEYILLDFCKIMYGFYSKNLCYLQMKCFVLIWFALQAITCGAHVHPSAYHPVFEYDVPVASQPIVYGAPGAHTGPYYGSYAVHTTPAVSHTFSQTQTHPVAYVKPVRVLLSFFSLSKRIICKFCK